MLKDPFSLIPDVGASVTAMRAACEALAQRLRDAGRQRDEAEMVLRRIVYPRRRGLELIRDHEVGRLCVFCVTCIGDVTCHKCHSHGTIV